jgi:hypothetical protein
LFPILFIRFTKEIYLYDRQKKTYIGYMGYANHGNPDGLGAVGLYGGSHDTDQRTRL